MTEKPQGRTERFIVSMDVEIRAGSLTESDFAQFLRAVLAVPDADGPYGVQNLQVKAFPTEEVMNEVMELMREDN